MKLFNLFNTPKSPETIFEELRLQEASLKRRRAELEIESRQGPLELDKAIAASASCSMVIGIRTE